MIISIVLYENKTNTFCKVKMNKMQKQTYKWPISISSWNSLYVQCLFMCKILILQNINFTSPCRLSFSVHLVRSAGQMSASALWLKSRGLEKVPWENVACYTNNNKAKSDWHILLGEGHYTSWCLYMWTLRTLFRSLGPVLRETHSQSFITSHVKYFHISG